MTTNESPLILDALEAQLQPEAIQEISARLGADTAAISKGVSMALPILLGGLTRNVASAEGAASLDSALDAHDGTILDNRAALLASEAGGTAILAHLLGSSRAAVEEGVSRASGLNAQQVSRLFAILAPLVMAVLGRMKRTDEVGAEQLFGVMGKASLDLTRQSAAAGELSRILEVDDDGQIADDVARIGGSIAGGMLGQSNNS